MLWKNLAPAALVFTGNAVADTFDYEVRAGYASATSDFSNTTLIGSTRGSSDTDSFNLGGSWYFTGLSDDEGPRSRAAFLSRASSLMLAYSRGDGSSSSTFTDPVLPPVTARSKTTRDDFSAGFRYVWKQSGWYGLAGVSRFESKFRTQSGGPVIVPSIELDATLYNVGVGKYLGEATAIDLNVSRADTDGLDTNNYALTFTHIGKIGQTWQYGLGVSASLSDQNDDDGTYGASFSLFPTRNLEFGVSISHRDSGVIEGESYNGFVSWFVRPNVELTASYTEDNPDTASGQSFDNSATAIGASIRF
jgi:hypothetical protein